MSKFKKTFRIKGRNFIHAGEASINIQNLLKSMDFDLRLVRRIAICGYEGEMNMVMHGGDGSLSLEIDADRLILELTDDGPGIEEILTWRCKPVTRRLKMLTVKWVSARAWDSRT
jgi:anti-sigma regulatory factor (Ser/Thr protein kinase)